MSEQLWWYVARSSGMVALLLAGASVIWGLLLSSGYLDHNPPKKWLLNLHSWLGGLAVSFTAVHLIGLWLDSFIQYSVVDFLIPYVSDKPPGAGPIAWGIVAFYLLLAVQITSVTMRRIPRRWWRLVHMTSFLVLITGIVHGATAGTDVSNIFYIGGVVIMSLTTVFLTTYRVLTRHKPRPNKVPAPVS